MKSFKNVVSSTVIAVSLLFAASFSANAIIIKQNIFGSSGDQIGSVSVEINQNALNTGILDTAFGDNIRLVEFELGDLFSFARELEVLFFEAVIDTNNLGAGLEFFNVDSNDIGFGDLTWAYQLNYEAAFGSGFLDIFDLNGNLIEFDEITFGAAEVSVSAPATIALASLAMAVMFMRRKRML